MRGFDLLNALQCRESTGVVNRAIIVRTSKILYLFNSYFSLSLRGGEWGGERERESWAFIIQASPLCGVFSRTDGMKVVP